jgi:hypothetical protein
MTFAGLFCACIFDSALVSSGDCGFEVKGLGGGGFEGAGSREVAFTGTI